MADYILKLFDRELIRFSACDTGETPDVNILRMEQDALPLLPPGMEATGQGLARWLRFRKIPPNRAYVHSFLAKAGLSVNATLAIMDVSKGLSLNDSYWVVRSDFRKNFAQCNLYENRFSELLANMAFTGEGSAVRGPVAPSPEFTTHGMLPKCWRRLSGKVYLYKGGTEGASNTGNEPYSEYYAWQVAQVLGVNAIPYGLAKWKANLCSRCELFTSKETGFVPVGQIVQSGGMQAVIDYYAELGQEYKSALEDMVIFDAVIGNTDRHLGNFGFLVASRSNRLAGPAPLFDHGNALFNFAAQAEMESREAFLDFADAQTPACYSDFFSAARLCLKNRHYEGLEQLLHIKLKRHPRYNLPPRRLHLIETAIQERASRLLAGQSKAECELNFRRWA